MTARVRIAGDELSEARLLALPRGAIVEVAPSPTSWASAKRLLYRFSAQWCRGHMPRLRFVGVPRCAFGTEHRMLRSVPGPSRAHPPCLGCRERPRCSPPETWSAELQPFGPADPLDRLRAHLVRLSRFVPDVDERLVDAVEAMARATFSARPGTPFLLEPSVALSGPSAARLVVFFGDLPPGEEEIEHEISLARLRAACAAFVAPLPSALEQLLVRHGPFPMPLGFELGGSSAPMVKVYARLEHAPPSARHALLTEALDLVQAAATPQSVADAPDTEMLCIGLRAGSVVQVKAYVARDPRVDLPEHGLVGIRAGHPLIGLMAEPRAYAVVDLYDTRRRPAKWDLRTRGTLLTGPVATSVFGAISPSARPMLEHVLGSPDALADVVAVASRADDLTLYFELC